jgi:hypothetical protein
MKLPVELPEVSPEQPQVEVVMLECRQCERQSPWEMLNQGEAAYEWQRNHTEHTGHRNFYRWAIVRNLSRVVRF